MSLPSVVSQWARRLWQNAAAGPARGLRRSQPGCLINSSDTARMPIYKKESVIGHPVDRVFGWHMKPGALERLTPPWADVEVKEREGGIDDGGRITLRVRPAGPIAIDWKLEHSDFELNHRFRDSQVEGPFVRWIHTHLFEDLGGEGTRYRDEVDWEIPTGGIARTLGGGPVFEREMEKLFRFRHTRLAMDLDRHAEYEGDALKVVITGSSGMIGQAITHFLTTGGHSVIRLVRGKPNAPDERTWDPAGKVLDPDVLRGADAVVHLAGEPIDGRWTAQKKKAILRSRVDSTRLIADTLIDMKGARPGVFISASAVGFYGDRGKQVLDETSESGRGFLSKVSREWEAASRPATAVGVRVVNLRFGVVLSANGGALAKMLTPFKMGIGGRLGSGKQYMSWVGLDDVTGMVLHALRTPGMKGPVNVTAPNPVPNAAFTDTMGRVLGRPTLIPLPKLAVRAMFGEMGEEALLGGARVQPVKALSTGYRFAQPDLETALRFQLGAG